MTQTAAAAQVSGGNILSMLAAMGAFRKTGEQILAERGITNVAATGWYTRPSSPGPGVG